MCRNHRGGLLYLEIIMQEIWKDINGMEDRYQISNKGRVRSKERKYTVTHWNRFKTITCERTVKSKILKERDNGHGYMNVNLHAEDGQKTKYIHNLMAEHFIPNPENKPQVNHKNGIKDDNRLSNLEWSTAQENIDHAWETGLFVSGVDNPRSKLNKSQVLKIREMIDNGVVQRRIAEKFNVCPQTITNIKQGNGYTDV